MRSPKASVVFSAAVSALVAGCCERSLLYQRTHLEPARLVELGEREGWDVATLTVGGVDLNGLVHAPRDPGAPWILYFGGNATPLDGSVSILNHLRGDEDVGLAVFAFRGYDGSEGRPTQRRLIDDGVAAAKMLETAGAVPSRLVIVGQSLGSGVAAQVTARLEAAGRAPAGLVLVSPFESIPAVARAHLGCAPFCFFPDSWRTIRRAPELHVPALVVHGTSDTVIPEGQGEAVAAAIPGARFVPISGRDHNDVWTPGALEEVRSFVLEHGR